MCVISFNPFSVTICAFGVNGTCLSLSDAISMCRLYFSVSKYFNNKAGIVTSKLVPFLLPLDIFEVINALVSTDANRTIDFFDVSDSFRLETVDLPLVRGEFQYRRWPPKMLCQLLLNSDLEFLLASDLSLPRCTRSRSKVRALINSCTSVNAGILHDLGC
jgi:hypothetical protein